MNNQDVYCHAPQCGEVESLHHILLDCHANAFTRTNVVKKWLSVEDPVVAQLVNHVLSKPAAYLAQFVLDVTALPHTINFLKSCDENSPGLLKNLTWKWGYSNHRERQNFSSMLVLLRWSRILNFRLPSCQAKKR